MSRMTRHRTRAVVLLATFTVAATLLAACSSKAPPAKPPTLRNGVAHVGPDATACRPAWRRGPQRARGHRRHALGAGHPPAAGHRGHPVQVVNLHDSSRADHHQGLSRPDPARWQQGRELRGVVLPGPNPAGLSAAEQAALAWYESIFKVRRWTPTRPRMPDIGMNAAGLQRAAHRHHGRDAGRGQRRVRLSQRLVPVQRGPRRRSPVRLPRRSRRRAAEPRR